MSDRGMKKWAPYKALVEQTDALRDLNRNFEKVERPSLSIDKQEEINELLVNYHGQSVKITYWKNYKIYEICSVIEKIDINNRCLVLPERKRVLFTDLVDIENYNDRDLY